jgi:hypothetical protein
MGCFLYDFLARERAGASAGLLVIGDTSSYSQSSMAAYMPLIEVCSLIMSWERCGTAPLELTAMKWGVSIGMRPGKDRRPCRGLKLLDEARPEDSKPRGVDFRFVDMDL